MFRKRVFGVLVIVFTLSLMASLFVFAEGPDKIDGKKITLEQVQAVEVNTGASKYNSDEGEAIYFVQLMDPSLALYSGGIQGLAPTSNRVTGASILDVQSSASVAYMNYLAAEQSVAISDINQRLARNVTVTYQYKATMNGFAMKMTAEEAAKVAKMANVKYVNKGLEYHPTTDHGPQWLGAPGIWDGSATGGLPGTKGEGVIVGVIDTGIDPWNPSFADVGDDSYDHTNPWGTGNYVGVCDSGNASYDSTFPCNDKLIGAWGYSTVNSGDPRDKNGHGSHTSSTAAGNVVYGATITTPTGVYTANISGVAPHANVVMYAACCTSDALAAAKEQVVLDGVDVVNYSIGASAGSDPEAAYATQWLAIREAGIFVATSAGNDGPGASTVGSPADLPWLTSVGASSHDRTFLNSLTVTGGSGSLTVNGQSMTGALITPTKVVFSSWYTANGAISANDARLCKDGIFSGTVDFGGAIVVCERGAYGRVAKGQTVKDAGAGGYILAQPNEFGGGPGALSPDPHVLPAVHIDYYEYQKLKDYMAAANNNIMGTIAGSTMAVGDQYGDIMAAFSSRGPSRAQGDGMAGHIVPAVTAPGRGIWAAYHQGAADGDYTYNVIQGTSMSSPHVAGAGALLSALHPTWTPSEIESAMMLTARTPITDDNGIRATTPFTDGAGHVDLMAAGKTGLLMNIATGEYAATLPQNGGDPTALNRAALGNEQCLGNCSWQRTFKSTLTTAATWTSSVSADAGLGLTVDPANFTIPAGGTQVVTITANAGSLPYDKWVFGQVNFTTPALISGTAVPDIHMPVAVKPVSGIYPSKVEISTRRNAGSVEVSGFQTLEVTALTVDPSGFITGTMATHNLMVDPTNDDPYDNLGTVLLPYSGTFFVNVTVAPGDKMLVAEVLASEAPDVDMFVGSGTTPSLATELCKSTTGSWTESCNLTDPTPGTYWILVQSWDGSANQPDKVTLSYAVVGADKGNLNISGPTSVAADTPYTLTVSWDEPALQNGDRLYGGFDLGTDAGHHGNIGFIPVYLDRIEDDVTKNLVSVVGDSSLLTLTYAITVNANITPEDFTYWLTDTIPAGMTYVPSSVTGGAVYSNGMITWNGTMPSLTKIPGKYVVTDNNSDANCDTAFGGYTNLESFGILPQSSISGDTKTWSAFSGQNPFQFYGLSNTGINFTDDGFAYFNSTPGATPWTNTNLPAAGDPNDLLAPFWNDMEIVYDGTPGSVRGVSLATGGSDLSIIEYDDIEPYGGTDRFDFEIQMWSTIDNSPNAYEIMYAYDNLSTDNVNVTVGVENATGTMATKYLFGNATGVITNGLVICFDYQGPSSDPKVFTYKVTVDNAAVPGVYTNTVQHAVDNPLSKIAQSSVTYIRGAVNEPTITEVNEELHDDEQNIITFGLENTGASSLNWSVVINGRILDYTPCDVPGSLSWVDIYPPSGSADPGQTSPLFVSLDSTGLVAGTYSANFCVASNDTLNPVQRIPVTLKVIRSTYLPIISKN